MKKTAIMLTFLLTTLLRAQTTFTVGTNSVPVIFEDAQLSQTNRVLICNDLTRVFAFATSFANLITFFTNQTDNAMGYLKHQGVCIYPFKSLPLIQRYDGKLSMLINENLSLSYVQCLTNMVTQTNLLKQADMFIAMLNAGGAVNLTAEQKAKLCWIPEGYDPGTPDEHTTFAGYLADFKFYPPSILTARWYESDLYCGQHLAMNIVVAPKNNPAEVFAMMIMYDGTQWRFVRV